MPDCLKNELKFSETRQQLLLTTPSLRLSFAVRHSSAEVARDESARRHAAVPANVPTRIWQRWARLSVSRSVCPFGRMNVWPVNNQPWLAANHPPSCREQVAAHTTAPGFLHSPCDVTASHLVTR